ncbi:MAG: tetratricopeptide repeat protein [Microscillaceae bacterium]|nr:tetratricopeptide repeat protein [Microscillaceae bacterium]
MSLLWLNGHICQAQNTNAKSNFEKGEIELHVGDFKKALQYYSLAIASFPRYRQAYFSRGKAQVHLQKYKEARQDFAQCLRIDSSFVEAFFYLGIISYQENNYEEAIPFFDQAIARQPNYGIAYNYRAESYRELGLNQAAIADYTEAIRCQPQNATLFYGRGRCYLEIENFLPAIEDFSAAIRLEPRKIEYHRFRSESFFLKGQYAQAAQDLAWISKHFPEAFELYEWRLLAFCQAKAQDFLGAVASLSQVLAKTPMDAEAWAERGENYWQLRQAEAALHDFEKAKSLATENPAYDWAIGQLLLQQKSYQAAIPALQQARQAYPERAEIWYGLGEALYHLRQKAEAKIYLMEAARLQYPADKMLPALYRLAKKGYKLP